jgi:hypothetical protein
MIKICYRDANELPPGLHATAERHGLTITVYLLPGLTAEGRSAALRRLRLSGRMGYGPRLPAVQLAFALVVDRIRTTIARAGSVFRTHPAGTTGPVMLISGGAIAFLALSAVSIHILREPRGPDGSPASGPAPAASAIAVRIPGPSQHLADGPAGSEGGALTTAEFGSDPLPPLTSPDLPGTGADAGVGPGTGSTGTDGTGSGSSAGTGTGSTGTGSTGTGSTGSSTSTGSNGTTSGTGAGSTPDPTVSASVPGSVSASVAPSVSVSASDLPSVSASVPVSVSASVPSSVSASNPVTVSASVTPSVSASVPASVYTSAPVTVSASVSVSASVPATASGPSPAVTASATGGACLGVGPVGVCATAK